MRPPIGAAGGIPLTHALPPASEVPGADWALLLECAKPESNRQRLADRLLPALDWSSLIPLAEDHGILGLAAACLIQNNETPLPAESSEYVRTWLRGQALFTLNLTAEMFHLFDSFAAHGIEAVVIKGPVLSARCYGDPGLRQYGDLDLIVRGKDILRTTELMLAMDYQARIPPTAIQAKKIPGEYVFRQPRTNLLVEYHTEHTFRYHPRPIPIDALFERQARVEIDGRPVPALSIEDELVLICIHGAKHFWERLVYVADVAALVSRQSIDWSKALSAADEVGARRMLYAGLRLASSLLDARLPERITANILADPVVNRVVQQTCRWLPAAGSAPPTILQRALFRIRMRGGFLSGLPYLVRLSLSPTEEDWVAGEEGKRHRFLDALGRPFRLAKKYGRDGKE